MLRAECHVSIVVGEAGGLAPGRNEIELSVDGMRIGRAPDSPEGERALVALLVEHLRERAKGKRP